MDRHHTLPEGSYILRRVKRGRSCHYKSREAFEAVCADMFFLWSMPNNRDPFGDDATQQQLQKKDEELKAELVAFWPTFLKEATLYVTKDSPLQSARPLLEAIVASVEFCPVTAYGSAIATANNACIDEIIQVLVSDVCNRRLSLSSLIPPLWVMQLVRVVVELLQEYYLFCDDGNSTVSSGTVNVNSNPGVTAVKLMESYYALVDRYIELFVEELVFPSYWNLDWSSSSTVVLVNGVHPSIYFCFTSVANLVYGWMRRPYLTDDRPCREIVARIWERGALAIASVAEQNHLSSPREMQIQLDTMHFVLFARMFSGFLGDHFSKGVTAALVSLLEAVAKRVRGVVETSSTQSCASSSFKEEIWDVPPIKKTEWPRTAILNNGGICNSSATPHALSSGAFIPWCKEFIRASHVRSAQNPPKDWERTLFQKLL